MGRGNWVHDWMAESLLSLSKSPLTLDRLACNWSASYFLIPASRKTIGTIPLPHFSHYLRVRDPEGAPHIRRDLGLAAIVQKGIVLNWSRERVP
jgi:hypothetical protein